MSKSEKLDSREKAVKAARRASRAREHQRCERCGHVRAEHALAIDGGACYVCSGCQAFKMGEG